MSEGQPCNYEEREILQKKLHPTMLAFLNFPAGRKTKTARKLESMKSPISIEATAPKVPCKVSKVAPRHSYLTYSALERKVVMEVGMRSTLETGGNYKVAVSAIAGVSSIIIPRSTLRSCYQNAKTKNEVDVNEKEDLHLFNRAATNKIGNRKCLTTESTRDYLQSEARARDDNNKGMSRKEMICLISEIESVTMKTAENHYDYLIRYKALP